MIFHLSLYIVWRPLREFNVSVLRLFASIVGKFSESVIGIIRGSICKFPPVPALPDQELSHSFRLSMATLTSFISSMEYIENLGIMMNRIILNFFKESNRTEIFSEFSIDIISIFVREKQ